MTTKKKNIGLSEGIRTVFESTPNGMILADEQGRMVLVNSQIEKLFDYPRGELIGQSIEILMPERYRSRHPSHRQDYLATPSLRPMGSRGELVGLRKDGGEFPVEIGLNTIETEQGLMTLASVMDISERKKAEVMKNEFISIVSHELRTPLTSIRGSLGLIAGGAAGPFPDKAKEFVDIAVKNCERMVRLVNNILDIEKIEAGAVIPRIDPVDLGVLVGETIEANRGFGLEFGVTLALRATLPGVKVLGDSDLLIRVLTNLTSNAVKFSPRGGVVEISVARHEKSLRTSVFNTGAGIPEKFRHLVFQKFAQATTVNLSPKGETGLGLSICKAIIDLMGGHIDFETTPNVGTTFYFDLPEWRDEKGRQ